MVKLKLKNSQSGQVDAVPPPPSQPQAGRDSAPMLTTKVMEPPPPAQDMRKITFSKGKGNDGAAAPAPETTPGAPAPAAAGPEPEKVNKGGGVAVTILVTLGWLLSLGVGAGIFIFKDHVLKNMDGLRSRRISELKRIADAIVAAERDYAVALAQFEEKKRMNEEERVNLLTEVESLKKHQEEMAAEVLRQKGQAEGLQAEVAGKNGELRGTEAELVEVKRQAMTLRTRKEELERQYRAEFSRLRTELEAIIKRGQVPELTAYVRSYFKSPLGPAAMFFLAERVFETADLSQEAVPYYKRALQVYPDSPYTAAANNRLKEIEERQPYKRNAYHIILTHKALPLVK